MTESPTLAAALAPVDAVIFDLDGVVTDTAELRAAAWKQLFDDVLQDPRLPAGTRRNPFSTEDYLDLVAGRTWEDAVSTFLHARGVAIRTAHPWMAPGNGPPSASRHATTNSSTNCSAPARSGPSPAPRTCSAGSRQAGSPWC
ncbi:hypothetical protein [Arthrobacter sp. AL12]|uniref:hypothetical protein n=1 Tax=Arthrobacter sp. AL12 TaxID=3042241 RepID=UPI00249B3F0C|nr:hypothetical protein [Arthrobacter sp. AL12]MDI3210692.1 hypothetical protein [Arthrobacter sp. AL12]